jgi:hypothetical protein
LDSWRFLGILAVQVCREVHPEVEGVSMLRSCVLAIGFAALLGAPGLGLAVPACKDSIDNDGDGETDFPSDPGCGSLLTLEREVAIDGQFGSQEG